MSFLIYVFMYVLIYLVRRSLYRYVFVRYLFLCVVSYLVIWCAMVLDLFLYVCRWYVFSSLVVFFCLVSSLVRSFVISVLCHYLVIYVCRMLVMSVFH